MLLNEKFGHQGKWFLQIDRITKPKIQEAWNSKIQSLF